MLTKRQNLTETIRGENPDRFVNQYEAFGIIMPSPLSGAPLKPGETRKSPWGVTFTWKTGTPGQMPVHDEEHIVVKDITRWQEYVKPPNVNFTDEEWKPYMAKVNEVDRSELFIMPFIAPGIFELCHHLCEIKNCLVYFLTEPEAMHGLIDCLTEWELALAAQYVKRIKPDGLFHHDDWGSHTSTFLSPAMFEEFLLPAYKKIYGFYKANGVELIVHHSDSYAATLVPFMIEMGIDIWQGVVTTNNIPELIKNYGKRISFMGGIDSGVVDRPDWTPELIAREARKACQSCGKLYFIPNTTQGTGTSTYPGVYEAVSAEIDKLSKEMF